MLRDIICHKRIEGVVSNTVLVWGNHIPVTHREMAAMVRQTIGVPRGAGFYGLEEGIPKSVGKSVSLNLGNTDWSDKTLQAAHLGKFYKTHIWASNLMVPVLIVTDGNIESMTDQPYEELVGVDVITKWVDELYDLYAQRSYKEEE